MTTQVIDITGAEWEVMMVIWASKEANSAYVSQVLEREKGWKPTTTKTLLGRLVKKGLLATRKEGRGFVYSPLVSQAESVQDSLMQFTANVCNTKRGQMLANLLERLELSQTDLDKLETIIQEKRQTAPEEVVCDCAPGQCDCHRHHA